MSQLKQVVHPKILNKFDQWHIRMEVRESQQREGNHNVGKESQQSGIRKDFLQVRYQQSTNTVVIN